MNNFDFYKGENITVTYFIDMVFATLLLQEAEKRNTMQPTMYNLSCNASLTINESIIIGIIKYKGI